jgi:ADP-ribosyl-[dinitrogen reductase] hydrolase
MIGYGSWNQPPGTWSDDSSLTFCTAESLLDGYDAEKMLTLFVRWYKEGYWGAHHKLFDIGQTTRLSIARFIKNGFSNMNGEFDVDSNGNGSLMRILPMAFYLIKIQDIDTRYNVIKEVSSLTHAHFRSVLSCFIYVEFAIHLINGNKPQDAYNSMQKTVNDFVAKMEFNQKEVELFDRILKMNIAIVDVDFIRSSGYVLSTLEASLWCVLKSTTYVESTLKAVNLGGDTDTTGTVTGGIAAIAYGIDDIPDRWLTTLARKEDIINLASQLESKLNSE